VLGLAAGLPDPLVGLAPGLRRGVDLIRDDRPDRGRDLAVGLRVDVEGVHERAVDVVLALVEGAVPDPHRTGAAVPGEVVERRFGQVALAADAVHDLELVAVRETDVRDIAGEVLRLGVESEHVQAPEGEGRVADPAVAIVPVALTPRRLRERGGCGGEHHSAWRVAEPLQGQRRALQVDPPWMVGEGAGREPAAPVLGGRVDALEGLSADAGGSGSAPQASAQKRRSPSTMRCRASSRWCSTARFRSLVKSRSGALEAFSDPDEHPFGIEVRGRARVRVVGAVAPRPTESASCTSSHPVAVAQVVSSTLVPGT
jgi:hypothetical protein